MVCTLNKVVMYSNGLERCTAGLIDTDIVFNATMIGIVDNLIPTDIDARNAVRSPTYATSNLNKVREVIVFPNRWTVVEAAIGQSVSAFNVFAAIIPNDNWIVSS